VKSEREKKYAEPEKAEIKQRIKDLGNDDYRLRDRAHKALTDMGGRWTRSALTIATKDGDLERARRAQQILDTFDNWARIQWDSVNRLGVLEAEAKASVPLLIEIITEKDGNPELSEKYNLKLKVAVIRTLGGIGPDAKASVPGLIAYLKHDDADARKAASETLGKIGAGAKAAAPALLDILKNDPDPDFRIGAANALGSIEPEKNIVDGLIHALKTDKSAHVRVYATHALGRLREKAALPALLTALEKDTEADVRSVIAQNLWYIGTEEEIVPGLTRALADKANNVKIAAAQVLEGCGPKAKEAAPALLAMLKDPDADVREVTVRALGRIGPEKGVVDGLRDSLLKDTEPFVRGMAAQGLAQFGPKAREAVHDLETAYKNDPHAAVKRLALTAVIKIEPEAAIPRLVVALADKDGWVKIIAAHSLGNIGPKAKEAVPALEKMYKDDDQNIRGAALFSLAKIEPEPKLAMPRLIAALADKGEYVKQVAAEELAALGPKAGEAVADLEAVYRNEADPKVRRSVLNALVKIEPGPKLAVPRLLAALTDQDRMVRWNAASSLGGLGPKADAAVDGLITALGDFDPQVKRAAIRALEQIGPEAKKAIPALTLIITADPDDNADPRTAFVQQQFRQRAIEAIKAIEKTPAPSIPQKQSRRQAIIEESKEFAERQSKRARVVAAREAINPTKARG